MIELIESVLNKNYNISARVINGYSNKDFITSRIKTLFDKSKKVINR